MIVQANGGDQNLGGNNFDDVLMEMIKEELYTIIKDEGVLDENYYEKPTGRRVTEKQKRDYKMRMSNLRKVAEEVKIKLSEQRAYRVKMKQLLGKDYDSDLHRDIDIHITQQAFEYRCQQKGLYSRFSSVLKMVMNKKSYTKANVDKILLIGGSCFMPRIKEEVGKLLHSERIIKLDDFNPLLAVSLGASWYGYNNQSSIAREEFFETIPYPIGLEVNCGQFDPFCYDGDNLPLKKEIHYSLSNENQTTVSFNVYRGKCELVGSPGMDFLGSFSISDISTDIIIPNYPRTVVVNVYIGTDGRVQIDAECENIKVEENEEKENEENQLEDEKIGNECRVFLKSERRSDTMNLRSDFV